MKKNPTLTRGLKIMAREGLTAEDILRRDFLTDLSRIPDLGMRTYLTLREYFTAQQAEEQKGAAMRIINLTQHPSTPEQRGAGVFDLAGDKLAELKKALNFEGLPNAREIHSRAAAIAQMAADHQPRPEAAMIGGALWLMAPLARELRARGIQPLFAFSVRETEEQAQPDGSVRKVTVFRHAGFVPAVE